MTALISSRTNLFYPLRSAKNAYHTIPPPPTPYFRMSVIMTLRRITLGGNATLWTSLIGECHATQCRHGGVASSQRSSSASRLSMVEKVDAEVVSGSGGKSPTAAKTEELIDSAKDVYSQITVRTNETCTKCSTYEGPRNYAPGVYVRVCFKYMSRTAAGATVEAEAAAIATATPAAAGVSCALSRIVPS